MSSIQSDRDSGAISGTAAVSTPPRSRPDYLPLGYRAHVLARFAMAAAGGYALASLVAIDLTLALPVSRLSAAMTGVMTAFVIQCVAFVSIFAARSTARACVGVMIVLALLLAWLWMLHAETGR